jgi:hypothetical protein
MKNRNEVIAQNIENAKAVFTRNAENLKGHVAIVWSTKTGRKESIGFNFPVAGKFSKGQVLNNTAYGEPETGSKAEVLEVIEF